MNRVAYKFLRIISLWVFLGLVFVNHAKAQQEPGFTHFMYNTQAVNAAYAGTKDGLSILLLSRHQWVGFDGAPQTQTFTIHGPVDQRYVGLGLTYIRDQIGPLEINNVNLDYAFKVRMSEQAFLSMGMKTGIDFRANRITGLLPVDENDPTYHDIQGKPSFNFGAGLYYYTRNYYAGISLPRLRRTTYNDANADHLNEERQERHLYVIAGYVWDMNTDWKLKPSGFVRHVKGAPLSADINLSAMYRESIVAGLSHRWGDALGVMLQFRAINKLWVGYAYDFSITPMRSHNSGTHEVMMMFDFQPSKPETIKSPRFF